MWLCDHCIWRWIKNILVLSYYSNTNSSWCCWNRPTDQLNIPEFESSKPGRSIKGMTWPWSMPPSLTQSREHLLLLSWARMLEKINAWLVRSSLTFQVESYQSVIFTGFRAVTRAWNWLPTKLKYQPVPLTLTVSNVPSNHFISERGTYVHVRYMLSTVRLSVVCL